MVKQGDFGRVMAEFWADGPRSTAPPGHWNEIRNDVTDKMEQLGIPKRIGGTGPVVSDLEWDVKSMFALNGGLHDAAIAAWNHKGVYDSLAPDLVHSLHGPARPVVRSRRPVVPSRWPAARSRAWSR